MIKTVNQEKESKIGKKTGEILVFKRVFQMLLLGMKKAIKGVKDKIDNYKHKKFLKKYWKHVEAARVRLSQKEKEIPQDEKTTSTNKGFFESLIDAMPPEAKETFKQNVRNYVPGERLSHEEIMKGLLDLDNDEIIPDETNTGIDIQENAKDKNGKSGNEA